MDIICYYSKSGIRLLYACMSVSLSSVPSIFGYNVPHRFCKAAKHLFKNRVCYHHKANDQSEIIVSGISE